MSLNSIPKVYLFFLGFWALVPCVLADFAMCQAGWEWVSGPFGLSDLEMILGHWRR